MKNLIRYQNEMKILGLDKIGLRQDLKYLRNLSIERLTEEGVLNGETKIGMRGRCHGRYGYLYWPFS